MRKPGINLASFVVVISLAVCLIVFFAVVQNSALAADDSDEMQESIDKLQDEIEKEEAAKSKLEKELSQIQGSVNTTQGQIQKTASMIKEAEETIARKEKEIQAIQNRVEMQREILKGLVQDFYYSKKSPLLYTIINKDSFSKFFNGVDHIATLNDKIVKIIDDIQNAALDIEKDKENIKDIKEDQEKLLDMKESQQNYLLSEKSQTQGEINERDATIGELQAKLNKLRSNISGYLGKSYDAKDIEDAAKFASKATGVRKDFILGMLVIESDLGRFTGGCYAKDSRMSSNRLSLFKDICEELDYSWKKKKVSCPPKGYSGTGGAMGVAQFMSDTWAGYKSQIASVTGHKPPDPWNLTDGVAAMGLKLARGGATKKSGECNAAKLYLSGTTSSKYNWYCTKVLYWADNYEKKLGS